MLMKYSCDRHLREGYWESWTATDTTVILKLTSSCYNEAVICRCHHNDRTIDLIASRLFRKSVTGGVRSE